MCACVCMVLAPYASSRTLLPLARRRPDIPGAPSCFLETGKIVRPSPADKGRVGRVARGGSRANFMCDVTPLRPLTPISGGARVPIVASRGPPPDTGRCLAVAHRAATGFNPPCVLQHALHACMQAHRRACCACHACPHITSQGAPPATPAFPAVTTAKLQNDSGKCTFGTFGSVNPKSGIQFWPEILEPMSGHRKDRYLAHVRPGNSTASLKFPGLHQPDQKIKGEGG